MAQRKVNAAGLKLIQQYEKCPYNQALKLCMPYQGKADKPGVITIGWGHVIRANEQWMKKGITKKQADDIFLNDIATHTAKIDQYVKVPLNDNQFAALASGHFNMGPDWLSTAPTLLTRLNKKDYVGAAQAFHQWCNSDGQYRDGLFYRRLTEMYLFLTGKLMPQVDTDAECRALISMLAAHVGKVNEQALLNFYNARTRNKRK